MITTVGQEDVIMAYENIWLEEGEEKIVIVDGYKKKVDAVTIDNDTGNFMFEYYVDKNSPQNKRFEIVINDVVIDLWFYTHFEDDPNTMVWTLEKYFRNGDASEKKIFEEVSKAVEAYGCAGRTNEMKKIFKERFGDDHNGKGKLDLARFEK